jgi:hypothetical protein
VAVEEQQRRPVTAVPNPERRLDDVQALELEAGEQLGHRDILCKKIARVFVYFARSADPDSEQARYARHRYTAG